MPITETYESEFGQKITVIDGIPPLGFSQNFDGTYKSHSGTHYTASAPEIFTPKTDAKIAEERETSIFLGKVALFFGKAATSPLWGTYLLSKKIFEANKPESPYSGIKALFTTAALFISPLVIAGLSEAAEKDRVRNTYHISVVSDEGRLFTSKAKTPADAQHYALAECERNSFSDVCIPVATTSARGNLCLAVAEAQGQNPRFIAKEFQYTGRASLPTLTAGSPYVITDYFCSNVNVQSTVRRLAPQPTQG